MKMITKNALFASIAAGVMASSAMAADMQAGASVHAVNTIDTLPDEGTVRLSGVVQTVDNSREFILSDTSGTVQVELASPAALGAGDEVTVIGRVDDPWYRGPSLVAAEVMPLGGAVGDLSANETSVESSARGQANASRARADASMSRSDRDQDYIDADIETRRVSAGTSSPITGNTRQDANSNLGAAKYDRDHQYKADVDVDVDEDGNARAEADVDADR